MRLHSAWNCCKIVCTLLLCAVLPAGMLGQSTTLTTLPNPPYNGGNSLTGPAQVTFVMNNTNPFPILLKGVSNWLTTTENNSVWQLYYTATALSGAATDVTVAPWTLVATSAPTPATATGIAPISFTGLSFTIPAATQYRFALRNTGPGSCRYSGTGAAITPNTFTGGGVTLHCGDFQIAGANVGYSGSGTGLTLTPRYFTGSVTFEPALPCVNPPTPGTVSSSANPVCLGVPFTLSLTGSSGGTGQTYQWQSSPDNATWTNITGATSPTLATSQTVTTWYRCQLTCGATVSTPGLQILTPAAVSGTYTINNALPTGGTNFNSFNAAYDYIKCGISGPVIFNVDPASGPYTEQLIMDPVAGASAVNTVTFNGNGRVLQFLSTNTNQRAVIKLNGADHIRFDSIHIKPLGTTTTEFGFGVQIMNNADSNIIRNCIIDINTSSTSTTNYAGVVIAPSATSPITSGNNGCDFNQVLNNTITGGAYGITLVSSTTLANRDAVISGNKIIDWYTIGIYVLGSFNPLVEGNEIYRPTRNNSATPAQGIFFTSLSTLARVNRNLVRNLYDGMLTTANDAYGIVFSGCDALATLENKVTNNIVKDIRSAGTIWGIYNTSSDNVWYYHNTISLDDATSAQLAGETTRGFFQTTLAAGIEFKNNLISLSRTGAGPKHAIYFGTNTSNIASNYNNFFLTPSATVFTGFFTSNQATLTNWQTAATQDANSLTENPLYTNLAAGNLRPNSANMNDRATPVGVSTDFDVAARSSTTPDIGAYEFTVGGCIAPPTPGTAVSNVTAPICPGEPVILNLTGNSTGLNQTYQWESAPALAGPWTAIGAAQTIPTININPLTTLYYRCQVTCAGNTQTSATVQVLVNGALPGGTYTINSALPTGGTNYQSYNDAYAAMRCGIAGPVIFNVVAGSGPYNEQLIMAPITGASAVNTVTFNGNGTTIRFSSNNTDERAVIKLRNADHIRFDSLVVNATGTGTFGFGFHLINNADSNIIRRCTVITDTASTSTNYAGIVISGTDQSAVGTGATNCDNNLLEGNTVFGGFYGITLSATGTTPVLSNQVNGNRVTDYYSFGIYLGGTRSTLVEGNDMSRPVRRNSTTVYGVYLTGVNDAAQVSKNRVHNLFDAQTAGTSQQAGIFLTGADAPAGSEIVVSNNAIYNLNGEGIIYGLYNASSDNVRYYHNTVANDNTAAVSGSQSNCFYQTTAATGIEIRNNLFSISRGGTGNKFGINIATSTTAFVSDNNNIYRVPATANAFTGFFTANRITLADWQAATGDDINSLAVNPFYTNPLIGNLEPRMPILDNKGVPAGIGSDIEGENRHPVTPDIGAWEFVVPNCVNPPAVGPATANPSSGFCVETPIKLDLTGYILGAGQTYQWQVASAAAGPYTNLGNVLTLPDTTIISNGSFFYRCVVTCSGGTPVNSAPVQVIQNPGLLAGTYTIDKTQPTGGINYNSFNDAVTALECGITGTVIFNVAADTYTEQVRMRRVRGASPTARVIFQSANGNPASVILTNNATTAGANYTLQLDSASFITWKNITIRATNATFSRVVDIANTASADSISGCVINAPAVTVANTNSAGIYSGTLRGVVNNVINGNTISGGAQGIYIAGASTALLYDGLVLDSNTISGTYQNGIFVQNGYDVAITKNTVNTASPRNATGFSIQVSNIDSGYNVSKNVVNINGVTGGTENGIYFTGNTASISQPSLVNGNIITAATGNTGILYGLYHTTVINSRVLNNVVSINTSGITSYGLYSTGGGGLKYYNNSVQNNSTSATNNFGAFFSHTSGTNGIADIQNNIFSHSNNGTPMHIINLYFIYSDYNMLYTAGPTMVRFNTANLPTLQRWRDTSFWDINSIVYRPAFTSNTNLQPNPASPEVWAIHGRGTQIPGNSFDINGNSRPTTLQAGVPDLGAYEFVPTSIPVALVATPAAPAANSTQTFMLGTDTVAKVNWGANVPATITGRRYSGVVPPGLAASQPYMYFYTDFDVPAGSINFNMNQFYIDPWQGFIPTEPVTKLGRTNAAGAWLVNNASRVDDVANIISENGLTFMHRFTGLTDGIAPPPPPPPVVTSDSSNRGTRFWVDYGHHQFFTGTNNQNMVLYLSAEDSANVTVRINGTAYSKTYRIPANTAITSEILPKSGLFDARILDEGKFPRGISINSDVPIVAYAHIYGSASSGATMLLPVGTYGYEYFATGFRQNYAADCYAWFSVIADRDSTFIEITPANPTRGGRPANVPFTVILNRGEVYQVLGAINTGSNGFDLTGSRVKSVPNNQGKCHPFAMFSGSSRTAIQCNGVNATGNGDNLIQQNFPSQAWGRKYLTAPTSNSGNASSFHTNIYRVVVKDPTTVVKRNGNTLTGLINTRFYEFDSNTADYIESDKPVMVSQYMSSSSSNCANSGGNGDPEMFYLSPLEQGVKRVVFYRNTREAITLNTLTLITRTAAIPSLLIDGSNTFDHTYPHPNLTGYTVVVKRWTAAPTQARVVCDSAFTAITYGQGSVESYGYNAGALVKNLLGITVINNVYNTGGNSSPYTCAKTPFRFSISLPYKPSQIVWQLSQVPNLTPNADVTQVNPVPIDSTLISGDWYYRYTINQDYVFTQPGNYVIPINVTHPSIESCNNSADITQVVRVIAAPVSDFTISQPNCLGTPTNFSGSATHPLTVGFTGWEWNFGDGSPVATGQNTSHLYATAGTYNVKLRAIAQDGCVGDTTKAVVMTPLPLVNVAPDSLMVCRDSSATFNIQNPVAGITYNWYNAATGGTLLGTGTAYTVPAVTGTTVVWAEAVQNGCISATRKRAVVNPLPLLANPVAVVDTAGVDYVTFRWAAVANALGYQVSVNGGPWIVPSSGPTGLTHTVNGLLPLTTVTLKVRALGGCKDSESATVTGRTKTDQIFFPNSFSPNGDGRNDVWRVYGYVITDMRLMIFNQWGDKIFESRNQGQGWDGRHNNKLQPSGVYMYVCELTLRDGSRQTRKGSINLIQ